MELRILNKISKTLWTSDKPVSSRRPAEDKTNAYLFNFHNCTVHLDTIKVFYLPTDAQKSCFKRILKFTLK